MERHIGQLQQAMVVATTDHHDGADPVRGLRTLHLSAAACRERHQHETNQRSREYAHSAAYGQVAGLAPPMVALVLMPSHHVPPSPVRRKTWS